MQEQAVQSEAVPRPPSIGLAPACLPLQLPQATVIQVRPLVQQTSLPVFPAQVNIPPDRKSVV